MDFNLKFNALAPGESIIVDDTEAVKLQLTLAGFVIKSKTIAVKPAYETESVGIVQPPAKTWKISSKDDENELINDDDLLDEEDLRVPTTACLPDAKKKACNDCTCGLAEAQQLEQQMSSSRVEIVKSSSQALPKSSCGSCYLGDAFRCASCPYSGMPAFAPGDKFLPQKLLTNFEKMANGGSPDDDLGGFRPV